MVFLFQNLDVYRCSVRVCGLIHRYAADADRGSGHVMNQLKRAALSIPSNIAEGTGRESKQDRNRFMNIARGSLHECIALLEVAREAEMLPAADVDDALGQLEEVAKMMAGLLRYWNRQE